MNRFAKIFILSVLSSTCFWPRTIQAQPYEVLPPLPTARGQVWLSDGPSLVMAENRAVTNRFRLGVDFQFGPELRYLFGWTIIDEMSSGEHSASVGDVSRGGSGPNIGYFFIPDKLALTYTFLIEAVAGSRVSQEVTCHGHQLSLGYRFYSNEYVHVEAGASYLILSSVTVPVFDVPTQTYASATYPSAQVWSLGLTVGAYFF